MKFTVYTLNEPYGPGICPVCQECWSEDPRLECTCTRAQPDDEQQMHAAYLNSAQHRTAKLNSDQLTAERRSQAATPSPAGPDQHGQSGNVIPLTRPRHPACRRAR